MLVPLTMADFLDRAESAAAGRVALVDEPDQPSRPVPTTMYGELLRRVRAWQAGLDALGVGVGERVAVVSPNSARLLELLYAIPASGRVCVPVNYRLTAEEIAYILRQCDASVVFVDPDVEAALGSVEGPKRFVLGEQTGRASDGRAQEWEQCRTSCDVGRIQRGLTAAAHPLGTVVLFELHQAIDKTVAL